eukprot:jgi/Ulvmu1/12612/UM093_0004.1
MVGLFCCLTGPDQPESPRQDFSCAKELLQSSTRAGEGLADTEKSDTCLVVVSDDGRLALLGHDVAMESATIHRSSVLVNLQGSLDPGASAGLPVTGENFRRWRECTTASVASIQQLSPPELIVTLQAAHAMADHEAIYRHCAALRGEFHSALGLRLPEALLASTEACDRPFHSTACSTAALLPDGSDEPAGTWEADEGYSAASIAQVLSALPPDLAKSLFRYAFVPTLHMAPHSSSGSTFCPQFSDADGRDSRSAPLWFPPQFTAFPVELHPFIMQAVAPCIEDEAALTVDLSASAEAGSAHAISCVARALPRLPTLAWVKISTGSLTSSPASPSGSDVQRECPHACACAELLRAVCAMPQVKSICMENPEQRMPRYGSGMLSGSCELDPQALDLVAELTRNLCVATGLTSLTLRNLPLRLSGGSAFIEAAGRLPALSRFHLDNCDVDDKCMRKLHNHLRKFESLDDFHLATVGGVTAADPTPAIVSVGVRPGMRSVSLRAPLTVQSAMQTVKAVARLTGLERLQLDLHHAADTKTPYYNNNSLLGLCDIMADHLPHSLHLTHLAIGGVISAACAASLGELLCRLPRLRRLDVNGLKLKDGHRCSWPVEASQVAYGLSQARALSHLSVAFHVMSPPDPAALVTLGDEIWRKCQSISTLQSLAIHNGIDQQLKRLYHVDSLCAPADAVLMHELSAAGRAEYPWLEALAACMRATPRMCSMRSSGMRSSGCTGDLVPFDELLAWHELGGDEGSDSVPGLRALDLANNCLGVLSSDLIGVAARLCAEVGPRMPPMHALTRLDLRGNDIDGPGMSLLAPALRHLPELRLLDLSRNEFGDVGADALAHAVHAGAAEHAAGANVYVAPDREGSGEGREFMDSSGGGMVFGGAFAGLALLEELRVNDCEIEQRGCEHLVRALRTLGALRVVGVRGLPEGCVPPLLSALWEVFPRLHVDV